MHISYFGYVCVADYIVATSGMVKKMVKNGNYLLLCALDIKS